MDERTRARRKDPNPTVGTLERYARARGGRIRIEFEPTSDIES